MLETLPDDGNRYEIIDGDLFETPAPTYAHQRIVLIGPAKLGELLLAIEVLSPPPRLSTATRSGRRISGKAFASTGSWIPMRTS